MRLSAELFEEVVDALRAEVRSAKDARLEPRVGLAGEAVLLTIDDNGKRHKTRVRVRDISRSGMGIYYQKPVEKDHRFIIQLQSSSREPIWMVCIAAYCRAADADGFLIGARIQKVMRSDQVRRIEAQCGDGVISVLNPVQRALASRISNSILS